LALWVSMPAPRWLPRAVATGGGSVAALRAECGDKRAGGTCVN
jgi:hypothetical protein